MSAIIYRLTNTTNGKIYVGLTTKSLKRRWSSHCSAARRGVETLLYRAIRKYGESAFTRDVIEETTKQTIHEREQHWISVLRPAYNMTKGGEGVLGHVHSELTRQKLRERAKYRHPCSAETRKKISESKRGVRASDTARRNMSATRKGTLNHFYGRNHTDEARAKIGKTHQGKIVSDESRKKMSDAHRGKTLSAETRAKMSAARRGKPKSAETRAKISAAGVLRWQQRRKLTEAPATSFQI
jgi:group I intron endonuclease